VPFFTPHSVYPECIGYLVVACLTESHSLTAI